MLEAIHSPLVAAEIDALIEQGDLTPEVVVDLGEDNLRSDDPEAILLKEQSEQ